MNKPSPRKVAVVVGCAQGIGARTAQVLADRGDAVVLADLDGARVVANAEAITSGGGTALGLRCDVRSPDDLAHVMDVAVTEFGQLNVLHNNAAAMHLIARDGDVLSMDLDLWDETMAVNLRGQMLGIRAALPHMVAGGGGAIVNTSSVCGVLGDLVLTAYGASKAAIGHLTLSVATQYGRDGVRCNAVLPGLIRVVRPGGGLPAEVLAKQVRQQLLDIVGDPDHIAQAVAFLTGDGSAFVTGQLLTVDGGLTAHASSYADARDARAGQQVA